MGIQSDRHIFYVDGRQQIEATTGSLDLFGADNIEVQIDHLRRTLWVNASGRCKLRIFGIRGGYEYIDLRAISDRTELYERAAANEQRISLGPSPPVVDDAVRDMDRIIRLQ